MVFGDVDRAGVLLSSCGTAPAPSLPRGPHHFPHHRAGFVCAYTNELRIRLVIIGDHVIKRLRGWV
jgi:hypothetical protein